MEVTVLDNNGNRYDPEIIELDRQPDQDVLVVLHDEPASFSPGDRVELIIASETYRENDLSDIDQPREALSVIIGEYTRAVSDIVYYWAVSDTDAVTDVLNAESQFSLSDFD